MTLQAAEGLLAFRCRVGRTLAPMYQALAESALDQASDSILGHSGGGRVRCCEPF